MKKIMIFIMVIVLSGVWFQVSHCVAESALDQAKDATESSQKAKEDADKGKYEEAREKAGGQFDYDYDREKDQEYPIPEPEISNEDD
jgi:uncharacterized protein YxeA